MDFNEHSMEIHDGGSKLGGVAWMVVERVSRASELNRLNRTRNAAGSLDRVPARSVDRPGDDLVGALAQLTQEMQRFESMLRNGRHLLQQHDPDHPALHDKLVRRQLRRIRACGHAMATRTRSTLEELGGLPDAAAPFAK
ncbi:MAG TPA: hypothetical protein VIP57_06175 [Candidatus Dormibacteraeota bacterium]|jgi:hypothetical protein